MKKPYEATQGLSTEAAAEVLSKSLPAPTLDLFLRYAKDASNWGGKPLVGGNIEGGLANAGRLSHMKMAGLLSALSEPGVVNGRKVHHSWIYFTKLGRALAALHGVVLDENVDEGSRAGKAAAPQPPRAALAAAATKAYALKLEVKNVKSFTGMEGLGFNADLLADGAKVALVIDDASGGPIQYQWKDRAAEGAVNAFIGALPLKHLAADAEDWEKRMHPNGTYKEDLDTYVAGLVDDYMNDRRLRNMRKTCVLFSDSKCKAGEMYRIKHNGDPEGTKARVLAKHPDAKFL